MVSPSGLVLLLFLNHTAAAIKVNASKLITTHLATHQKNAIDLYKYFYKLFHHNPQVRGSNP